MNEQQIKQKIQGEGWEVVEEQTGSLEHGYTPKALDIVKKLNDVIYKKWIHYTIAPNGECYLVKQNPFPVPPQPNFRDQLNSRISELVSAGTIKAGYIERANLRDETALIVAVMPDNTFKTFHVQKVAGNLHPTEVIGKYPFGFSGGE